MSATPLQPQTAPLTTTQANHLLRRSGFGSSFSTLESLVGLPADKAANHLVEQARTQPQPQPPTWSDQLPPPRDAGDEIRQDYQRQNRTWLREYQLAWMQEMATGGLREKMTLFWHNHFVTQTPGYGRSAILAHSYLSLLRQHALANFQTFVHQVGLNPAMLLYLDGARNQRRAPNENYGRELLELFTMGIGNYTERDILEAARALTGYRVIGQSFEVRFVANRFDSGEKTIFGQKGSFDYDGLIELIFAQRQQAIALFMATKLYRFFVSPEPHQETIASLASTFVDNDWQIAPTVAGLLGSAHFYRPDLVGAQIKSPLDLTLGFFADGATPFNPDLNPVRALSPLGQELLNPPDVAGWPGHRNWLSTTTLPLRWNTAQGMIRSTPGLAEDLLGLAQRMPAPNDAEQLARDLARFWLAIELPADEEEELQAILLGDIPLYEWDLSAPGAGNHLALYYAHITSMPAYQLM